MTSQGNFYISKAKFQGLKHEPITHDAPANIREFDELLREYSNDIEFYKIDKNYTSMYTFFKNQCFNTFYRKDFAFAVYLLGIFHPDEKCNKRLYAIKYKLCRDMTLLPTFANQSDVTRWIFSELAKLYKELAKSYETAYSMAIIEKVQMMDKNEYKITKEDATPEFAHLVVQYFFAIGNLEKYKYYIDQLCKLGAQITFPTPLIRPIRIIPQTIINTELLQYAWDIYAKNCEVSDYDIDELMKKWEPILYSNKVEIFLFNKKEDKHDYLPHLSKFIHY